MNQTAEVLGGIKGLITAASGLVNTMLVLVAGLALVVFFWGLVRFLFKAGGDPKAVEDGKKLMIWGVVALFVMVSIWGLVRFIRIQLGITNNDDVNVPGFIRTSGSSSGGEDGGDTSNR